MIYVYQDGADFYCHSDEACHDLVQVVSAPFRVSDFDLEAAMKARSWFIREQAGRGDIIFSAFGGEEGPY